MHIFIARDCNTVMQSGDTDLCPSVRLSVHHTLVLC